MHCSHLADSLSVLLLATCFCHYPWCLNTKIVEFGRMKGKERRLGALGEKYGCISKECNGHWVVFSH